MYMYQHWEENNCATFKRISCAVKYKMSSSSVLVAALLLFLQNLAEANVELETRIEDFKKELRDGKVEIERTTDDYIKLKVCHNYSKK